MTGIAAVLTAYKRPHLLKDQLEAFRRQTVAPQEIVIWHNAGDPLPLLDLRENESVISSSVNRGVWPRFLLASCLNADYCHIADDDTFPGHEWFQNCLDTMAQLTRYSLIGAVGVTFPDGTRENRLYWGWKNPQDTIVNVDLVGHAWFCKRELLDWFVVDHRCGLTCGEDYALSATARKLGGCVVCPPHPKDELAKWGHLRGFETGSDDVALWRQEGEEEKKAAVHQRLRDGGWTVVAEVQR